MAGYSQRWFSGGMAIHEEVRIRQRGGRAFLDLPRDVMRQFGADLQAVQNDERPFSDHKHLKDSVGPGAIELIENGSPAYRAVYCAKFADTVFILHAFTKTTNGVDRKAMNTARERYKEMLERIKLRKTSSSA